MNEIHNAFIIGRDGYTKDLTSAYDLDINCKGETESMAIPPNDGVSLLTDDRGKARDAHTNYGSVIS